MNIPIELCFVPYILPDFQLSCQQLLHPTGDRKTFVPPQPSRLSVRKEEEKKLMEMIFFLHGISAGKLSDVDLTGKNYIQNMSFCRNNYF